MNKKTKGALIAAAAAGLFGSAASVWAVSPTTQLADSDAETVRCYGINSCKGHGSCHSADNACAGHNACKGKGWIEVSEEECKEKGGKELEDS